MTATYQGSNNIPFHPGLTTLRQQRPPHRVCLLDACNGHHLPQRLADLFSARRLGIAYTDWLTLRSGPDAPHYWETYQDVLDMAQLRLADQAAPYHLIETEAGHLFAVEDTLLATGD